MQTKAAPRHLVLGLSLAACWAAACTVVEKESTFGPAEHLASATVTADAPAPGAPVDASVADASAAPEACDAADASASPDAAAAPYTCPATPLQCTLACDAPACVLACNPGNPLDCRWDCAAPTCTCAEARVAPCALTAPEGTCDVKCEKPECTTYCPVCTTEPCAPCETICKTPHCVTHCQAPKVVAASGNRRVIHCQAPKPDCSVTCAPPVCRWSPPCEDGDPSCPPASGRTAECDPPSCMTDCAPPPPPVCDILPCDATCDAPTDCMQTCDKPECSTDPVTGVVSCEPPTGCTQTCQGGACHVTTCF
ncbi:MAG: hypothetical protein JWP97_2501 [Labilithrix sp.]|nr:hypothetical protein [Labilithrix sp.]